MFLGHNMECNQRNCLLYVPRAQDMPRLNGGIKAKLRESEKNIISQAFGQFAAENAKQYPHHEGPRKSLEGGLPMSYEPCVKLEPPHLLRIAYSVGGH